MANNLLIRRVDGRTLGPLETHKKVTSRERFTCVPPVAQYRRVCKHQAMFSTIEEAIIAKQSEAAKAMADGDIQKAEGLFAELKKATNLKTERDRLRQETNNEGDPAKQTQLSEELSLLEEQIVQVMNRCFLWFTFMLISWLN